MNSWRWWWPRRKPRAYQSSVSSNGSREKCSYVITMLCAFVILATMFTFASRWMSIQRQLLVVSQHHMKSSSLNLKQTAYSGEDGKELDSTINKTASSAMNAYNKIQRRYPTKATTSIPSTPLPPLSTLIGDTKENITGNVQFLLDFAIIGHSKCGTTTFLEWMKRNPYYETLMIADESYELRRGRPARLVHRLYHLQPPETANVTNSSFDSFANSTNNHQPRFRRGFKSPNDIQDERSMRYLRTYFPQTKLIVGIRHPILWFQSLYNFRVQNVRTAAALTSRSAVVNDTHYNETQYMSLLLPHPNRMIGACQRNMKHTCTDSGLFHVHLAKLGKTNLSNEELEQSFSAPRRRWVVGSHGSRRPAPMPNPIFLYEVTQLRQRQEQPIREDSPTATPNDQYSAQFQKDVQTFLGLEYPLTHDIPHELPGKTWDNPHVQAHRDAQKIQICDDEYRPLRQHLLRQAQEASLWIRRYFIRAPGVVVSSRNYFEALLERWMHDPCVNVKNNKIAQ